MLKHRKETNYIKVMWRITVLILLTTLLGIFLINKDQQYTNINAKGSLKPPEPSYFNIDTITPKRQWCSRVDSCRTLAEVGYYEARGETDMGAVATMYVVMNRVESGGEFRSQNNIKAVVYKKHQFSYLLDGSRNRPVNYKQLERMYVLAYDVIHRDIEDVTNGSLYYHASYVSPKWKNHYEYTVSIGRHIFYK